MKITHRLPWATPYGYTEAEIDTADDGETDYAILAAAAIDAEAAYIAAGGGTRSEPPIVAEARAQGATPYVPPMGQRRAAPASAQQTQQVCPNCGGPLSPAKQTSKGRVRECTSGCLNPNDDRYALSVWIDQRR